MKQVRFEGPHPAHDDPTGDPDAQIVNHAAIWAGDHGEAPGITGRRPRRRPSAVRVLWPALGALVAVLLVVAIPLNAVITTFSGRYRAAALLEFAPASLQSVGSDSLGIMLPRYAVVATSPSVLAAAAADTGLSVAELRRSLRVTVPPGTLLVEVELSGQQPAVLADAVNAVARGVLTQARDDRLLVASLAAPAVAPKRPVTSDVRGLRFAAWAAAVVLALLAADAVAVLRLRLMGATPGAAHRGPGRPRPVPA